MSKIFVEDTEIRIIEKVEVQNGEHEIKGDFYVMQKIVKTDFKSSIYAYPDISVLISKVERYNEDYYEIVLFSDEQSKAWELITLSVRTDIKVKRLTKTSFIVIAEDKTGNVTSEITFCTLKPNTKVEAVTINFTKLNEINFIGDNTILLSYDEEDANTKRATHVLSLYNDYGKLLKTFYEFNDGDSNKYSYSIEGKKLKVIKNKKLN